MANRNKQLGLALCTTTMSVSLSASSQDPHMTYEEPTHEPLNLLPPQVVKPIPRLSRLSFDIVECIKHSRHQDGVFRVKVEIGGRRQDAILKLVRN
jgi:hypothetical protein